MASAEEDTASCWADRVLLPLFILKGLGFVSPPLGALPLQLLQAEPLALSLLNASEYEKRLVALQVQLRENAARHQAELLSAQTRLAELESQVRDPACWTEGRGRIGLSVFAPVLPLGPS